MPEVESGAASAAPEAVVASTPIPSAAPEPAAAPTIPDTMAAVYDKHYPSERVARSTDNGQFKSKDPAVEAPLEAAPAKEITQDAPAAPVEPVKVIDKPQAWAAEKAEIWSKLSPDVQEYIAQREGDAQKRISELGTAESVVKRLNSTLEPYRAVLGNVAPDAALANYLRADMALRQNPHEALQWLAKQYNIDLSRYGQPQQPGTESDPLIQEIQQLKRELYETKNHITAREHRESETRVQSLQSKINDFAKSQEHWSEVESEVNVQAIAIQAANPDKDPLEIVKEAYGRAVRLNEAVQAKVTKAKSEKEAAAKAAEDKRKAEDAKKHVSLDVKSRASAPKAARKSLYDDMAEIYDQATARG